MLMYGRKRNNWLNEWMKEKMCEVTTVSLHDLQERNYVEVHSHFYTFNIPVGAK